MPSESDPTTTPHGGADDPPTTEEAEAAERAADEAPDVGDTYDDAARRGAETEGEGRVE